jgi:hypothetical protein
MRDLSHLGEMALVECFPPALAPLLRLGDRGLIRTAVNDLFKYNKEQFKKLILKNEKLRAFGNPTQGGGDL